MRDTIELVVYWALIAIFAFLLGAIVIGPALGGAL